MAELLLIRHGQTVWNLEGRYTGQSDIPLSDFGLQQARMLVDTLIERPPGALYSSDLQRAQQTAQPLAQRLELPITVDPRLREINQGLWEGLLFSDIKAKFAREFAAQRANPTEVAAPEGESIRQVQSRVLAALEEILTRHKEDVAPVAIVSHGFAIALIRLYFSQRPIEEVWDLIPGNVELIHIQASATL